jgi:hypothetical protein
MPNNSKIIVPIQSYNPLGDLVQSYTGEKFQADGFYSRADGFHTIQINLTDFTGELVIQGTLAIDPTELDWFDVVLVSNSSVSGTVDTTGAISIGTTIAMSSIVYTTETINANYNFTGNYVWIRTNVSNWTAGTINSIMMNY